MSEHNPTQSKINQILLLGEALVKQNSLDKAIISYQKAIKLNPGIAELHNKLGEVYLKKYQFDEAIACFREAIALAPNSAWYHQNLGEAIAHKEQPGGGYEATRYYRHALKLNPEEVQNYHNALDVQADEPDNIKVNNPIFIVGCGHSGTSLMLTILGNHPNLYSIPYESRLLLKNERTHKETMYQWDGECINAGKQRWVEKSPSHIFYIKKLSLYRPNSQFIIMLRDGRDVVCSLKHRKAFPTYVDKIEKWVYDNLAGLPYWNNPRVMVVKYENLVTDTETTLEKLFKFLGETYREEVLKFNETPKHWYSSEISKPEEIQNIEDHKKLRNWQINQPLFDGRGRWKTEMTEEEKIIFKEKAQKYLVQFGYVEDDNW
ncbi:MAG: tetratricopeptide repeat protein [Moorea sp. SIO4A3]|nr:tetratricopeptide repeat protein [Moorena sp. SIO4A3]